MVRSLGDAGDEGRVAATGVGFTGEGAAQAPDHDENGEQGEAALNLAETDGGELEVEPLQLGLHKPKEGEGAKAEGEGEAGTTDGRAVGDGEAKHEVEGSTGDERGGEADDDGAVKGGTSQGPEFEAGHGHGEEARFGKPAFEAEGDDDEEADQKPGEDECGAMLEPLHGHDADGACDGSDDGVGEEAGGVVEGGVADEGGGFLGAGFACPGTGHRATHADTVETGDESCKEGGGGGVNGWHRHQREGWGGGFSQAGY